LLYIYCKENDLTQKTNELFRTELISREVIEHFVFLPLDIFHPEGWATAHSLGFRKMPLIALIRPRDGSLESSQIFVKHEGIIGETALLSYLRMENRGDGQIIEEQDEEYRQAVQEAEENERRIEDLEQEDFILDQRRLEIEREFESIPTPVDKAEAVTIRFRFPDGQDQVRKFFRTGPSHQLFAFVRKFMFPREFVLMTGFPLGRIAESGDTIGSLCSDHQFIVYVELEDN
jgi:hypothetical protein